MPTSTSSNGMNVNPSAHPDTISRNSSQTLEQAFEAHLDQRKNFGVPNLGVAGEPTINSGLYVTTPVRPIVVKQTGYNAITGSFAGDHRPVAPDGATPAMDVIKNSPSVREQMRGQRNSKNSHEDLGKGFKSTIFPDVGD
jgi:hypothetical protein